MTHNVLRIRFNTESLDTGDLYSELSEGSLFWSESQIRTSF